MIKSKNKAVDENNFAKIKASQELILNEWRYIRDKVDRDGFRLEASRNRVMDMILNNYDKCIDLEIFFLKLFIPILGISFAATGSIFGIDTITLKYSSSLIIASSVILVIVTFLLRKITVNSEEKFYNEQVCSTVKTDMKKVEKLDILVDQIQKDLKLAGEKHSTAQ